MRPVDVPLVVRAALVLALLLGNRHASAAGAPPSVGLEWEQDAWSVVMYDEKAGEVIPVKDGGVCPADLFETVKRSDVVPSIPLLAFTRDIDTTLEIVSGPVDHDDDKTWNDLLALLGATADAFTALQVDARLKDIPKAKYGGIRLTEFIAEVNKRYPVKTSQALLEREAYGKVQQRYCYIVWSADYSVLKNTNTQTNVAVPLADIAKGKLSGLFSQVLDHGSGQGFAKRLHDDLVKNLSEVEKVITASDDASRGALVLMFYKIVLTAYNRAYKDDTKGWRGWEGKNLEDIFLKTDPTDIYDDAQLALAAKLAYANGSLLEQVNRLQTLVCSYAYQPESDGSSDAPKPQPLNCKRALILLVAAIDKGLLDDSDEYLFGHIPKAIGLKTRAGKPYVVMELRRRRSPINQAATYVLDGDPKEAPSKSKPIRFKYKDLPAMKSALVSAGLFK
jgi:hypothetical protein